MRSFIKSLLATIPAIFFIFASAPSGADELTSALYNKMGYLSQNQAVISKNLSNADTPGYKAMEIKEPRAAGGKGVGLATTSPMHIGGMGGSGKFKATRQKDAYETAPNGNNISIEEQMIKMSENNLEHQQVTNLTKKMNGLLAIATGTR